MAIDFYDTSAVLSLNLLELDEGYISPLTLMELENIKDSNKPEGLKYASRQAVRTIIHSNNLKTSLFPQNKVEKLLKKYPFLQNINARELHEDVNFITADGAQYLFACQMPHLNATFLGNKKFEEDLENYTGWSKHYPDEQTLSLLYQNPKINVLNCRDNEFAEIFVDKQLKDILFWTGESYRPLKYKEIRNDFLGQTIRPLNIEQKMAFDLLQNPNTPLNIIEKYADGIDYDWILPGDVYSELYSIVNNPNTPSQVLGNIMSEIEKRKEQAEKEGKATNCTYVIGDLLENPNTPHEILSEYIEKAIVEGHVTPHLESVLENPQVFETLRLKEISKSPLQQREEELSSLEAEAKTISEAEALIDQQKEAQDIGGE